MIGIACLQPHDMIIKSCDVIIMHDMITKSCDPNSIRSLVTLQ